MNIPVDYIDTTGIRNELNFTISRLAFAKHLAIAGQGYAPKINKLIRTLGMVMHYSFYLQRDSFYNNHFSEPPIKLSDPTEKGQFSNLAGKAIADYLSKRINNSQLTINYEAEMRLRGIPVTGPRPDLLAYSPNSNSTFAIEAKGYSAGARNMANHKIQAQSGNHHIPVNFSIASVSYNIYNSIKCNYHDPYNENIQFNLEAFRNSSKQYYSGLSEYLDEKYFEVSEATFGNERFYEIGFSLKKIEKLFKDNFPFSSFIFHEIFDIYSPKLILPIKIKDYSENGISIENKPFAYILKNGIYIDNDRIGLSVR
ncbi:hypothetical protein ACS6L2_12915 [Aquirufa ecclesiirivi]